MIVEVNATCTPGPEPLGAWLWFTAIWSSGECAPLPAWYCTNEGEPKIITDGWFPREFGERL